MIQQSPIHRYSCLYGVYKSTFTAPRAFALSTTGISTFANTAMALGMSKTCFCYSASTVSLQLSVKSAILVAVQLPSDASCITTIDTGCELYMAIFCTAVKVLFKSFSMKVVSRMTENSKFLKFPSTTHTRASLMRM